MEKTNNEFLRLKEFKSEKCVLEDGVYLNILEYPYRLILDLELKKAVMTIESTASEEEGKIWIKRKDGRIEHVFQDDVQEELDKKSQELLEKHHKLIRLMTCA